MKRTFDLAAVCFALPLLFPIIVLMGLLIRRGTQGPALFKQRRVGLKEMQFEVYKLRTMIDRGEGIGTSVTTRKDSRITTLGSFLRKMKIDELPQLINVFRGDMSLVGPRPDVPEIVQNYTPEMRRIFRIRPGVTSLATLHLMDEEVILAKVSDPDAFYENVLVPLKVQLAMEHVDRNSFAFDLKIFCQTMWMLTLGRWWPIKEHPAVTELRGSIEGYSR